MISIVKTDLYILNTRTRMPFRYGIATMTASPMIFVRVELEDGGRREHGVAGDLLAMKWFTKDPDTTYCDDITDMLGVIRAAAAHAGEIGDAATVFDFWRQLYKTQADWGASKGLPPLLTSFGTSLIERAVIDAFCRIHQVTFRNALIDNTFGVRLGSIHSELEGREPKELLPAKPLDIIYARHTIGLGDPLTDADITPDERLHDGLPQSLEACILSYGTRYFKIKLGGDPDKDFERLKEIASVIGRRLGSDLQFTLDGNENFRSLVPFRVLWKMLLNDSDTSDFMARLLFVEQPFHRDIALGPEVEDEFKTWPMHPPVIIDESDAELHSLPTALDLGYAGTSHKNCKGVFKGIANACLIAARRSSDKTCRDIISGEDLSLTAGVPLLEDLAVMATLGVPHVERNGHHYFRGLDMLPQPVQDTIAQTHTDVFKVCPDGLVTLNLEGGRLNIDSVNDAPFGYAYEFDPSAFTPADDWTFDSLQA